MNYTKIRKEEFEKLKSLFPDNEEMWQKKFITDNHKKDMDFIDYLREYRRNRKMSQQDVTDKLGIDQDVYARYERKKLIVKAQN